MVANSTGSADNRRRRPPATNPEDRENEMIALAFDVAEQQMRNGTASAQVITHFLKFGSERDRLEREKIRKEIMLSNTRDEQIRNGQERSEQYDQVISMMKIYTGDADADGHE